MIPLRHLVTFLFAVTCWCAGHGLRAQGSQEFVIVETPDAVEPFDLDAWLDGQPQGAAACGLCGPKAAGPWFWQFVPQGILYKSYLAGVREPRLGTVQFRNVGDDWLWDNALGGRVGLFRYGSAGGGWAEGFQVDFEGARTLLDLPSL